MRVLDGWGSVVIYEIVFLSAISGYHFAWSPGFNPV